MSINVTCRACGKTSQAPGAAAGKNARCPGCGNLVPIPGQAAVTAATVVKRCTMCGIDVSGQKRTKDNAGRYYCQPCWSAKVAAGRATERSPQPVLATASVANTAPPADPFADHDFPPLPGDEPAGAYGAPTAIENDGLPTLEECADCGLSVPETELVPDADQRMVCASCARKELDLAPPPLPAPAYRPPPIAPAQAAVQPVIPYRTPQPVQARRMTSGAGANYTAQMIWGGIICAVGVTVTAGTYLAAASGGGGRYTVAWGAIVFGGFRFFRGLTGMLGAR